MKEDTFNDELFTYFQYRYDTEFERSQSLVDRMNLGLGVLSVLGGLAAYLLSSFKFSPFYWRHLCFYIPLAIGAAFLLKSLWHFGSALARGWSYIHVPTALRLGQYVDEMKAANDATDPDTLASIRGEFINIVAERYKECATVNWYLNIERQTQILRLYRWAMLSLLLLLLTSVAFLVFKGDFPVETTPVKIVNPVEIIR